PCAAQDCEFPMTDREGRRGHQVPDERRVELKQVRMVHAGPEQIVLDTGMVRGSAGRWAQFVPELARRIVDLLVSERLDARQLSHIDGPLGDGSRLLTHETLA